MSNSAIAAVILAAGKGTRMKSDLPKVLHRLDGKPLIKWVVEAAGKAGADPLVAVVGHRADKVRSELEGENLLFALQEEQLGTAHAVAQAEKSLERFRGDVFVLCGDVPLISPSTLGSMLKLHREENSAVTLLTVDLEDPSGYGRILRDPSGKVAGNVEDRDATEEQKKIKEINGGEYVFDSEFLFSALKKVNNDNRQGEFYLPDLISLALEEGRGVSALKLGTGLELTGVNSPDDLAMLEDVVSGGKVSGCQE